MPRELVPGRRWIGTGIGFGLLYLASPGIVTADGLWWLALVAIGVWARYASRPGRRAGWIELATGGAAWAGICSWSAHVWEGNLAILGLGHGVYMAFQGWLLRRFARRLPLALAAPCAWMLVETIRAQLEPPFGLPWMRLGIHLHDQAWISGSARVWGVGGLSLVLAALGGLIADLWSSIEVVRGGEPAGAKRSSAWRAATFTAGLGPLCLGLVLRFAVPAPATVDGPRVLLVQPAIPQERKMKPRSAQADFADSIALTRRSLDEARAAGEPEPDLVAWGETMLRAFVVDPELAAAIESGTRVDPWQGSLSVERVRELGAWQDEWVDGVLFGGDRYAGHGVLPQGTAFLSGAEYLTHRDGRVRRKNAVFVWQAAGQRPQGPASKRHLVPGAETMLGLERFEWVRAAILSIASYVPDLAAAGDDAAALSFEARDGRAFRFGVSVCFDNAFDDPYTEPVRRADIDFHLVVSNEAWFRQSQEADQMIAFSRLIALQTGRAIVRATNSGITAVIAPDGRELGRIRQGGRDREVPGTLRITVPVPAGGDSALFEVSPPEPPEPRAQTPFVRSEYAWLAAWIGVPLCVLAWLFKSTERPRGDGDRLPPPAPR